MEWVTAERSEIPVPCEVPTSPDEFHRRCMTVRKTMFAVALLVN